MDKKEKIEAIIRLHVKFDPTKGLQCVEIAAEHIDNIGTWVCIDDESNDFGIETNWRKADKIKKGDILILEEISEDKRGIIFVGKYYYHDITKFKQL